MMAYGQVFRFYQCQELLLKSSISMEDYKTSLKNMKDLKISSRNTRTVPKQHPYLALSIQRLLKVDHEAQIESHLYSHQGFLCH